MISRKISKDFYYHLQQLECICDIAELTSKQQLTKDLTLSLDFLLLFSAFPLFFFELFLVCVWAWKLIHAIPRQCSPAGYLKSRSSSATRPNTEVSWGKSGARGNANENVQAFPTEQPDPFFIYSFSIAQIISWLEFLSYKILITNLLQLTMGSFRTHGFNCQPRALNSAVVNIFHQTD